MSDEQNTLKAYIFDSLKNAYDTPVMLSESAYGKVESYTHKDTGKKIILITSYNRNDHVLRTLREINSPYLPHIFEVCSDSEAVFTIEEYIEGTPLSQILNDSLLNEKTACKYISDICIALSYLHGKNIIHRDIKPSNIIITPKGTAVLIDFNIARKITDGKKDDTSNLGTVGYAAPEQFGISQSGFVTDIYPLGVILNEMLTGVHPTVNMPKGRIGKIISRCVSTQMLKRYQSVSELQADLKKFI